MIDKVIRPKFRRRYSVLHYLCGPANWFKFRENIIMRWVGAHTLCGGFESRGLPINRNSLISYQKLVQKCYTQNWSAEVEAPYVLRTCQKWKLAKMYAMLSSFQTWITKFGIWWRHSQPPPPHQRERKKRNLEQKRLTLSLSSKQLEFDSQNQPFYNSAGWNSVVFMVRNGGGGNGVLSHIWPSAYTSDVHFH